MIKTISKARYLKERAIVDKAEAYRKANATYSRGGWSTLDAEKSKHPDYAACDNAMRGRVEQFELLRDLPERIACYISDGKAAVWTDLPLGQARVGCSWRIDSHYGSRMFQLYATIRGREYTGRGMGEGMCVLLRETAASKRSRGA